MEERFAHSIDELNDIWARCVLPFVKPILEANAKGRPDPVASGVLVSWQEKQYLLTAHHVIEEPSHDELYGALYTYLPEQVQITGPALSALDPHDIALVEIPRAPHRCLRLPHHLAFDIRHGEHCLIFGYQARDKCWDIDNARNTLRPTPFSYLGAVSHTSEAHFEVRLNRKQVQRHGKPFPNFGKLNGISGGGAFVLRNNSPRLAGVLIEYHANEAKLVCTNSAAVWSLARQI